MNRASPAEVRNILRTASHYKFWRVEDISLQPAKIVSLQGQFDGNAWPQVEVLRLEHLGNPATKQHAGETFEPVPGDPHLTAYVVKPHDPVHKTVREVEVLNQFTRYQSVKGHIGALGMLLVPAGKGVGVPDVSRPEHGQHYACYDVEASFPPPHVQPPVDVQDQFDRFRTEAKLLTTITPKYLCVPVLKQHDGPRPTTYWRKEPHLALYEIASAGVEEWNVAITHKANVTIHDQFLQRAVKPKHTSWLGVPTMKYWTPPPPTQ
jgi:hypothetical protein